MKFQYFPGCTLRTTAKAFDVSARQCAQRLGFELCEIENWQCCGGVFLSAKDEIASKLPSVRALIAARDAGQPLAAVCSACYNVLKQTNHAMQTDADFAAKVNQYLAQDPAPSSPYHGEASVCHYLEILRDTVGFDALKKAVCQPLAGKKIAAYYGCMLLRPSNILKMDDPENPRILEDFISALGGEPIVSPKRNECCGGYVVLENRAAAMKQATAICQSAKNHGAEMIVTACPLCKYNLEKSQSEIPVFYFTELLAQALGLEEAPC